MQPEDKNMTPLLSIITICRNDEKRLKITIDSLMDFYGDPRFEHVVMDGKSTDGTAVLVAPLLHKVNFKFVSGSDSGIYDAMNRGVMHCNAPLLLFLNCGDTMIATPRKLFDCFSPLVTHDAASALEIACFPIRQIGVKRQRTFVPKHFHRHSMPTSHQGMVFATRFVLQNQYQTSYKIAGDYDLYIRAERLGLIGDAAEQPLVGVEVEGVASSNPLRAYREYLTIARHRLQGWPRLLAMLHIAGRAICVITAKAIFPARWVAALRGV